MYTAIAQTRNINIEASSLLLDKKQARRRDLINIISYSTLLYRYQYFDDPYRSKPLYLAYITRVFLTSSPI